MSAPKLLLLSLLLSGRSCRLVRMLLKTAESCHYVQQDATRFTTSDLAHLLQNFQEIVKVIRCWLFGPQVTEDSIVVFNGMENLVLSSICDNHEEQSSFTATESKYWL